MTRMFASRDFGVWKLWIELKQQFPCFEFVHGHGLGLLRVGDERLLPALEPLFAMTDDGRNDKGAFFFTTRVTIVGMG